MVEFDQELVNQAAGSIHLVSVDLVVWYCHFPTAPAQAVAGFVQQVVTQAVGIWACFSLGWNK